MSLPLFDAG